MTTTTVHAATELADLEWYLQVVWPELDVRVCSVTEPWAGMAVAAPLARTVLEGAVDAGSADLPHAPLPFPGVTTTASIGGLAERHCRFRFHGEHRHQVKGPPDGGPAGRGGVRLA